MNRSTISISSTWTKGKLICHVHSHRENSKFSTFRFSGHNPFPCYEMRSTFGVVRQWLEDNGWKREVGGKVILQNFTVSDETGELLSSENHTYHYIPVEKKAQNPEKPDWKIEADNGNRYGAIRLYRQATGLRLKECTEIVDEYLAS